MCASLCGVLSVDEGVVFLAVLVGVCEGNLNVLALQVDYRIERVVGQAVFQEVFKSVSRENAPTVVHDGQAGVQVGVVAQHRLHDVVVEAVVLKHRVVGLEIDVCARLVVGLLGDVGFQLATFERGPSDHAVAE